MITHIMPLRTLAPLHCGIVQGFNDIDLPTAKSALSGHPVIPGSSLKGVLKDEFREGNAGKEISGISSDKVTDVIFGVDGNKFASAASFGDADLVALAVRSYFGTFAYLASPYTLRLLKERLERAGYKDLPEVPVQGLEDGQEYRVMITTGSVLERSGNPNLLLEELDLKIHSSAAALADSWAALIAKLYFPDEEGQAIFCRRFAVADDNALNFLCETGLPVDARISIDEKTGTVKNGALWYEESVSPETLFAAVVSVDRSCSTDVKLEAEELSGFLSGCGAVHCQVGGKATTGKGFVEVSFQRGA